MRAEPANLYKHASLESMSSRPTLLLVGTDPRVDDFARAFMAAGFRTDIAANDHAALAYLASSAKPAGIVFIVPVYWESIRTFMEKLRADAASATLPVFYLGDVIEANDQLFLKEAGVYTLTLGPVAPEEAVRYVVNTIRGAAHTFDGHEHA